MWGDMNDSLCLSMEEEGILEHIDVKCHLRAF